MLELLIIANIIAVVGLSAVSIFLVYAIMQLEILYKSKNLEEYAVFAESSKKAKEIKVKKIEEDLVEVEI